MIDIQSSPSSDSAGRTPADVARITLDGIESWPSLDDLGTWLYVAGPLGPERDPSGASTLSLIEYGQNGIFQCGSRWDADPAALERVSREAARQAGVSQIRLSPAPAEVKAAKLELADAAGKKSVLQETTTSNYPPYTAVFHATLGGDALARLKQALAGTPDMLSIEYAVRVQRRVRAIARVSGTVDPRPLASNSASADATDAVRSAIADGRLTLAESAEGLAPDRLCASARDGAIARAAVMLGSAMPTDSVIPGSLTIDATVALAAVATDEMTRGTDIASWHREGRKANVLAGAVASPPSAAARQGPAEDGAPTTGLLSVDRDMKQAPVAFIEARTRSSTALLRGPDFPVANLAAPVNSDIRIAVHYTDGGPAYETQLAWPGDAGCVLGPNELGLARLSLDASSRRREGARSIWAKVTYSPSGKGTADQHEVRFRYGDWTDAWIVVTREMGLGGTLAVEWRETAADGTESVHPPEPRQETNIVL